MTLNEAIEHCAEVIRTCDHETCKIDHKQLMDWLIELRNIKSKNIDKHNITFILGDPSDDGHGRMKEFHMVSTHSVLEITKAYEKVIEKLGFDYVEKIGVEYLCGYFIPEEYTNKLLALGVIDPQYIINGEYELDDTVDEFLTIFKKLIKIELPTFEWEERDLEETDLFILEGAAYGFVG